jgi:ribose transport system substrate-binding protein
MSSYRRVARRAVVALSATALLAACSSLDNSSSGSSGSSSGSGGSNGTHAAQLKQATTESPATFEGPTAAVKAPQGVKVAVITCYSILSGCVSPATGVQTAGKALGWDVRVFDGGGSSDKQTAQMLNAISWGASIILNIAIDPNSVQDGLHAAQKAGIPVGAGSNGLDAPNPVIAPEAGKLGYAFDVAPDYGALGKKAADWIAADSAGKANVVVYSDKTFPSVLALQKGLLSGLSACSGCAVSDPQYFTGDQVAQVLPQSVVSYLRSHPDTKYVFMPYDPAAAAVVPAIQQAGYGDKVKVVGVLGSQENLSFIRDGRVQAADAAYDNQYMGYALLDQSARVLTKQPLADPHGENLPFVVLDKSNVPDAGADWHASYDYAAKFSALWKG